ncbi:MAG: glucoamylase family protein, partial [Anaerolineaceae bacterium]|nr:glucoamylase family protein [Anaerolineaceae bacterium]
MTASLPPQDRNGAALAKSLINTQETVGRVFYGLAARSTARLDWKTRSHFLERLTILETALQQGYDYFSAASQTPAQFTTAAEWMLDNYVYVQQALKQVEENLPGSYERQLPRLLEDPYEGQSRIYVLAAEILKDAAVVLDMEHIYQAVGRFQTISVLSMGELWALPTMLRVSLLEMLALAISAISEQPLKGFSEEEMAVRLPSSETPELIVARIIPALRLISTTDWKVFFEKVSVTHGLLNNDPAGVYPAMDFETRDHYRGVIETLGFGSPMTEEEITLAALSLAESSSDGETYQRHVGYFLVDQGRKALEEAIGFVPRRSGWFPRLSRSHPFLFYVGGILLLTMAFSLLTLVITEVYAFSAAQAVVLWVLSIILSSSVAVTLINNLTTQIVPPHILPKLAFEKGIPEEARTMVVLPCLLTDQDEVNFLLRQLELHYMGNRDAHLSFALLSDFGDSMQQQTAEDEALLAYTVKRIESLNQRYAPDNPKAAPFFLFHRQRLWNPAEKRWMGWERKRGKLMEFNRLITGQGETSYLIEVGNTDIVPMIRYVITLDADTTLPPDTARRLVGTLAHPLNQAVLDEKTRKVVRGYGILQPRVQVRPVSASRSWFSRIYTEDTTLDLYTRAVSDVYQDLFYRGIFVGKGIYDVAAFSASLEGRVPENRLLSHDLFESFFARAALVTDILLMEDFPHTYTGYMQRAHRWVRGDWQLLPWLFRGKKQNAPLSLLNRWQIIDNVRRSVQPIALLLLLLAGWVWFPAPAWIWTLLALLWTMQPLFSALNLYVWRRINQRTSQQEAALLLLSEYRGLLQLIFLPHEALVMLDAIVSVLYRLWFSHEKLLEWTTARDSMREESAGKKRSFVAQYMRIATLFSGVVFVLALWKGIAHLAAALPILVLWLLADRVAAYLSAPVVVESEELSEEDRQILREQAARTWFFFERFVGPEDNWLPPDHFQEEPRGVIAHRTSPTNIGMLLMVYAGVYQLGYVGPIRLITRLTYAYDSMRRMKTFNGHLYNWYDTQSLQPLNPRYVSTVDSGNLAASLLVVEQFLATLRNEDALRWAQFQALGDTFSVLHTLLTQSLDKKKARPVLDPLGALISVLPSLQTNPAQWTTALWMTIPQQWFAIADALMDVIENNLDDFEADDLHDVRLWIERANYQIDQTQKEVDQLLPWARFLVSPPAFLTAGNLPEKVSTAWQTLQSTVAEIPRLRHLPAMQRAFQEELIRLVDVLNSLPDPEQPGLQEAQTWCRDLKEKLALSEASSEEMQEEVETLQAAMEKMFRKMRFGFLFDPMRKTFHIGYNYDNARLDDSYYDLMASEARITSFVAIAKGDVPMKHWLHLGRPVTNVDGRRSLISWSATMFEYLMPTLFMLTPPETLLSQSVMTTIYWQKKYGQRQNVPWGISESGYYSFDSQQNYQYKAFGVPGLGLKRGLGEDLVITPYASLLALPFMPQAVLKNMQQMSAAGLQGPYGYYEALDMTFARTSSQKGRIVQSYMAHHQGMILAALTNTLQDDFFVHLFHADSRVKIFEMLLYEQMPEQLPLDYPHAAELQAAQRTVPPNIELQAWTPFVKNDFPQVHCLSNNQFTVFLDQAGAGFSRWQGKDLNRWQADATKDHFGTWVYLYDQDEDDLWSITDQPVQKPASHQDVAFFPHQVKYSRRDGDLVSRMTVVV